MVLTCYQGFANLVNIDSLIVESDSSVISDVDPDYEEIVDGLKIKRGDTTYVTLGKKRIKIFEEEGETSVKIEETDKESPEPNEFKREYQSWKNFKGHWAGFGAGPNNFISRNGTFERTDDDEFMDINAVKSWNFNLNFAQYSIGIASDRFGITTGMGIEWSNYHFADTNIIQKSGNEIIAKPTPENTKKNRLQTTYLTIPLIVEFQFPHRIRKNRAYVSAGLITGIKLFSNTKIKYIKDGNKQKEKFRSDYYLNSIRYGLTARAGYNDCGIYVNYYLTPLFLEDHGPELYPIAAGIVLSF